MKKKIVYGSLSVLTAVFTVFVAAKAEVFDGDRANEPTTEMVENGQTAELPQTPNSLSGLLGSPSDGTQSLSLDKAATRTDLNALGGASLTENALGQRGIKAAPSQDGVAKRLPASTATSSVFSASPAASQQVSSTMSDSIGSMSDSIGSNGLIGNASVDGPAIPYAPIEAASTAPATVSSEFGVTSPSQVITQTTPATVPAVPAGSSALPGPGTSPTTPGSSPLENSAPENGSLESESSVEIGQPATEGNDPFAVPDGSGTEEMNATPESEGLGIGSEEDLGTEGAGADDLITPAETIGDPVNGTSGDELDPAMRKPLPSSGTTMPERGTGIESETGIDAGIEPDESLEDAEVLPTTPSGASDLGTPRPGSSVTPLPSAMPAPGSDIPDGGINPSAPSGITPVTPIPRSAPSGITPSAPTRSPLSPGGSTTPITPVTPGSSGTPFPESPSAAPIKPVTPLEPLEEDVIPEDMPTSGTESLGSSDRLVGGGFSPFQLAYLAIGGGLEGIPGGDQLLSAYDSGDLSAADIVDAGAASNRLGADASNQDNYTAGVERFLGLLSKDNN